VTAQCGWIQLYRGTLLVQTAGDTTTIRLKAGQTIEFQHDAAETRPLSADESSALDSLERLLPEIAGNRTTTPPALLRGSSSAIPGILAFKKLERSGTVSVITHSGGTAIGRLSATGNSYNIITSDGTMVVPQHTVSRIARLNSAEY
jgi:hypothetical protein